MPRPPSDGTWTTAADVVAPCPRPTAEEIARAVRAKTGDLLTERIRAGLMLVGISLAFFLVQDLLFFRHLAATLLPIKTLQIALLIVCVRRIDQGRLPCSPLAFALGAAAVFGFLATVAGIMRGTAGNTALLFIIITSGAAIGLPWGARAQAAFVAICAALLVWNDLMIAGTLFASDTAPTTTAMLTAGVFSVFVARGVDRFRFQIEEREMGLRRREDYFRSLIEHGGDLIVVAGEDGRVRYVSPSVVHLLHQSPAAWIGARLLDFVHPEDAPRLRAGVAANAPVQGGATAIALRLRHAGGTWRHLDGAIADLRPHAAVRGVVLNMRDVTERHELLADLRQKQAELTHTLRLGTIGEIASALAHEINQPLSAIANYAAACVRSIDAGADPTDKLRRGLQLISEEALRAGHIVHGLRDLSRKGTVGVVSVDVSDVVRRAVELMEPQARLQNVALELHAAEALPPVHADPIQIQQVVLNLLVNAIEAMQSSPLRVLSVATRAGDGTVEVCVRDTGSGFAPACSDRLFEPYFTTKPTGLGMGLAISRRIIEAHGGSFRAEPNPGGPGTSFTFTLPDATPGRVGAGAAATDDA